MKYNPDKYHRHSIRFPGYDYSLIGSYFITICTDNHNCIFGNITDGVMILNDPGRIVEQCWNTIPSHFPHVELDEWVIMPNHIHGILFITMNVNGDGVNGGDRVVGAKNFSPLRDNRDNHHHQRPHGTSKTVGSIVRGFKIGVSELMRQNTNIYNVWQRNCWEHIIRKEDENMI